MSIALLAFGCGNADTGDAEANPDADAPPYDYSTDLVYIDMNDMSLGGILLGVSEEELDNMITGDILSEAINDTYEPEYIAKEIVYSDGFTAVFADFNDGWGPVLFTMGTTSADYRTARGLAVGDSVEKMFELYGEAAMKVYDTSYFVTKNGDYFNLTVTEKDDKVAEIGMSLLTGATICGCSDGAVNPAYFMDLAHVARHDGSLE